MERRDFKLSSVLIIQILMALILYLLGRILNGPIEDSDPSIIYSILAILISIVGSVILAHGLLFNRMGSVSEYLEGVHVLNPSNIGLSFIINIIPTIIAYGLGVGLVLSVTFGLMAGDFSALGSWIFTVLLILVISTVYYIFTAYQYFVIADNPNMAFVDLFKRIFKVGKDLAGQTIKVFLTRIVLPIIAYVVILVSLVGSASRSPNVGVSLFAGIISIVFIIYILLAFVFFLNQLSLNYLDYKGKDLEEIDYKRVYQ